MMFLHNLIIAICFFLVLFGLPTDCLLAIYLIKGEK